MVATLLVRVQPHPQKSKHAPTLMKISKELGQWDSNRKTTPERRKIAERYAAKKPGILCPDLYECWAFPSNHRVEQNKSKLCNESNEAQTQSEADTQSVTPSGSTLKTQSIECIS